MRVFTRRPNRDRSPAPDEAASQSASSRGAWYPDPFGTAELRWYDGRKWTDRTRAIRDLAANDLADGSGGESEIGDTAAPSIQSSLETFPEPPVEERASPPTETEPSPPPTETEPSSPPTETEPAAGPAPDPAVVQEPRATPVDQASAIAQPGPTEEVRPVQTRRSRRPKPGTAGLTGVVVRRWRGSQPTVGFRAPEEFGAGPMESGQPVPSTPPRARAVEPPVEEPRPRPGETLRSPEAPAEEEDARPPKPVAVPGKEEADTPAIEVEDARATPGAATPAAIPDTPARRSSETKLAVAALAAMLIGGGAVAAIAITSEHHKQPSIAAAGARPAATATGPAHAASTNRGSTPSSAKGSAGSARPATTSSGTGSRTSHPTAPSAAHGRPVQTPRTRALVQQLEIAIIDSAMRKAHSQSRRSAASVSTTCIPAGAGTSQSSRATTVVYDCTAFVRNTPKGSRTSYRYIGMIDEHNGRIAWRSVGAK